MAIRRFIKIDNPSKDTPRAFSDFQNPYSAELIRTLATVYAAISSGAFTYDTQQRVTQIIVSGLGADGEGNPFTATITYTYDDASGTNTGVPDALWKETIDLDFEYDRDTGVVADTKNIQITYTYNPSQGNRIESYSKAEV